MEQNLNSNKTAARPSHQAVESKVSSSTSNHENDHKRLDEVAMKAAKRATNRIRDDEGSGTQEFTK